MKPRTLPLVYPTVVFGGLLFVLFAMWYASASQNNVANYLLLFFTLAVFLVSIPHTLLNLNGLEVTVESVKPAFAAKAVVVPMAVVNESRHTRHGCLVTLPGRDEAGELVNEIPGRKAVRVTLRFPATARGEYTLSEVQLHSSYPLGFLAARRRVATSQRYVVYPAPEGDATLPVCGGNALGAQLESLAGEGDDYAGVRAYVPGESQRHIDWKAVARGQPLMTKQFTAEVDDVLRLDFDNVPLSNPEQRLSQLALWVIEAERAGRQYSLRLPSAEIPAASGDAHYHRCLYALALFR
ncbi:MAG: DUF58 domain-containing protein [Chthoniobacterales bacterium]|nr:DUF58 domain-containing protein [Chthoniobacterales bacterium]